jgi:hypothetical protein
LILRLLCEQFTVAKPLRFLSEQPHPPCELLWTIFCEQYGINHLSQHTGTVFRFFIDLYVHRTQIYCLVADVRSNLLRSAVPVASCLVRHKIQHSSCLSPCEVLNCALSIRCYPSTLTLLQSLSTLIVRQYKYLLVFSIRQFGAL